MENYLRDIDPDEGDYILIHDPIDTWAPRFRTLERARPCWVKKVDPPCHCFTRTLDQYYQRLLQLKQAHDLAFEVKVIHWIEGTNLVKGNSRHSLLVGPNYTKTSEGVDKTKLFEEEWKRIKVELQLRDRQVIKYRTKPRGKEGVAKWKGP